MLLSKEEKEVLKKKRADEAIAKKEVEFASTLSAVLKTARDASVPDYSTSGIIRFSIPIHWESSNEIAYRNIKESIRAMIREEVKRMLDASK